MERGYSEPNSTYSNPDSASEMLARAYNDEPEEEHVAVKPVDDGRPSESSKLEEELDFLQDSLGLD